MSHPIVSPVPNSEGPGAPGDHRYPMSQTRDMGHRIDVLFRIWATCDRIDIPGPQKLGTGGTFNRVGTAIRTVATRREATDAGFYRAPDGTDYPRIQILTVQQILDGRQPQYPLFRRDETFRRAPKATSPKQENLTLPLS